MAWSFMASAANHFERKGFAANKAPTLWPSQGFAKVIENGKEVHYGACRRAVFYRYARDSYAYDPEKHAVLKELHEEIVAKEIPIRLYIKWIQKQGELYENYLIELAKELGTYVEGQTPIYIKEYNLSGKMDIIAINPETGLYTIIEAKSVYGHNGNAVLGTPSERKKGVSGTPRDSNLMQIALYQNKFKDDPRFEYARLVYGSRDTGRDAEFGVKVTGDIITWSSIHPSQGKTQTAPYKISDILNGYKFILDSIKNNVIPDRDFDLEYSNEKIHQMFLNKELSKTDTQQYEKILDRIEKNKELVASGKKELKTLNPIIKGDWQCSYCQFRKICYPNSTETQ